MRLSIRFNINIYKIINCNTKNVEAVFNIIQYTVIIPNLEAVSNQINKI